MILCLGTTPAVQRTMVFERVTLDAVNRAVTTLDGIAGKSVNVAKVLMALGEEPLAMGFIGGEQGARLQRELKGRGIKTHFISVPQATRQCITVIDRAAQTQTELVEESKTVTRRNYAALLQAVERRISTCRAVIMSGTLTPGAPDDFYLRCAKLALKAGALVVVDAKGAPLTTALNAGPDLVKPNRAELEATLGEPLKSEGELKMAMRHLSDLGAKNVVITNGSRPALAFDGKDFWRIHAPRVKTVNPIGSGDSFTAGLVWRLTKGETLAEACRWAAACGAANALTLMAGELNLRDVHHLVTQTRATKLL
jgi:tagatose 6-phosphate kinase